MFYGFGGKPFKRFFIDGMLDERYSSFNKNYSNTLPIKLPLNGKKQPPCQEFKSLEEYDLNNEVAI
jgi:hypothetical protein